MTKSSMSSLETRKKCTFPHDHAEHVREATPGARSDIHVFVAYDYLALRKKNLEPTLAHRAQRNRWKSEE